MSIFLFSFTEMLSVLLELCSKALNLYFVLMMFVIDLASNSFFYADWDASLLSTSCSCAQFVCFLIEDRSY